MSIYSWKSYKILQELDIASGKDSDTLKNNDDEENNDNTDNDYNADADNEELDENEPTEDDTDNDYTLPDNTEEDNTDETDSNENTDNQDQDNNTLPDEPNLDDNNDDTGGTDYNADADNAEADATDQDEENTQDDTDNPVDGEPNLDDDTGGTDYNADADNAEADATDQDTNNDDTATDNEDIEDSSNDELQQLEKNLLSDLSPQQMNIKNTELKRNFISLYELIDNTITRCNSLNKSDDMIDTLDFVISKLLDLKEMIYYYITNTFFTKTYIDNSIMYHQYLITLNSISSILSEIRPQDK